MIHSKDNEFANRRRGDDSDDDTSSSSGSSGSVDDLDELMLSNGFGSKINTAIEFDAVGRRYLIPFIIGRRNLTTFILQHTTYG